MQQRAFYLHWLLLLAACVILAYAFLVTDLTVAYVMQNSHSDLSWWYRLAALWSGHSGSLLLFIFLMTTWFGCYVHKVEGLALHHYRIYAYMVFGLWMILLFKANPFIRYFPESLPQGMDLNPLLQDLGMMIHPPLLYIGYVGGIMPFVISLVSPEAAANNRRLMLSVLRVSLSILTLGVILGSWWAYRVLGWGGYWAWDPVENVSLLPWLSQIVLFHALLGRLSIQWVRVLAVFCFITAIMGTILVRSGLVESVHAFALDPAVGIWLSVYFSSLCLLVLFYMGKGTNSRVFSSKSWPILLQNIAFIGMGAVLVLGLLLPLVYESFGYGRLVVVAQFFEWGMLPFVLLALAGLSLPGTMRIHHLPYFLLAWILIIYMGFSWVSQLLLLSALFSVLGAMRLERGRLAHLGFIGLVFSVVVNARYSYYVDAVLQLGEAVGASGMSMTLDKIEDVRGSNYFGKELTVSVIGKGVDYWIKPQYHYFPNRDVALSKVATRIGWYDEWYMVLGEEIKDGQWSVRLYHQYVLRWIWASGILMVLGLLTFRWRK